ncbi:MAG: hypothetical protein EP298_12260 [Gammaproteobacteria bacterium]|nr:MAG: hypothetical protein EP298_12260 [Gammaproteobacteria bacterium]UTW43068.1 hypothetical protein KFE69_02685 [bacterium SCSIO 12844]
MKAKILPISIALACGIATAYAANTNQVASVNSNTTSNDKQVITSQTTSKADNTTNTQSNLDANNQSSQSSGLSGVNWDLNGVKFNLHGFMSTGMTLSDSSSQYNIPGHGNVNQDANFSTPSLFGLQLNTQITDKLSFMTQIVADGDNTNGNTAYTPTVNWMYAQYQVNPNIAVRAGRFQLPLFLYSQEIEVGYNYPYTFLPNEVYRLIPFYSLNGVNLLLQTNLGDSGWNVSFQPFFGESSWDYDAVLNIGSGMSSVQELGFQGNKLFGGDLTFSNTIFKVHASYAQTEVETTSVPSGSPTPKDQTGRFYSVGGEMNYDNIWASSEFASRKLDAPYAALNAYYFSLGYHIEKFLPYINYAKLYTTNWNELTDYGPGAEVAQGQSSVTLGLNYYYNANLVLKGSWSYIMPDQGGYGLFQTKPDGNVNLFTVSASLIF